MPAITGLLAVTDESPEVPHGYVKIPIDLNKGVSGRYIWLCYARGDGPPITDIKIKFGKHPALDAGYQFVCDKDGAPQDLNEKARGEYIYMAYTRAPGVPVVDIFVQAWKYPSPPPMPPVDEYGHHYDRIDAELNKKSGGWYIYANQLKLPEGQDPPSQLTLPQFVEAFSRNTAWDIGRAQIDYDRIAVWKTKVRGYVYTVNTSLPTKLTFKSYHGIKETEARELVHSWELSSDVSGEISSVLGKLTARVGTKVGQSTKSSHSLETSEWHERDCETTVPADPSRPGASQIAFYIALVDLLQTYDMQGTLLSSAESFSNQYGVGYQADSTLTMQKVSRALQLFDLGKSPIVPPVASAPATAPPPKPRPTPIPDPAAAPTPPPTQTQKPPADKAPKSPIATQPLPEVARYRVRSGDSFWKIAQRLLGDGKRYPEIQKVNPGVEVINPNQTVSIPWGAGERVYTVPPGGSYWKATEVAYGHATTQLVDKIVEWNGGDKSHVLQVGDKVFCPL